MFDNPFFLFWLFPERRIPSVVFTTTAPRILGYCYGVNSFKKDELEGKTFFEETSFTRTIGNDETTGNIHVKRFVSLSFTRVLFLNTFNDKKMSRFPLLYNNYYVSDMSLRNVDVKRPVRELEQMYFRLRLCCITYDPSDNVMKRSHTVDLHNTECTKL